MIKLTSAHKLLDTWKEKRITAIDRRLSSVYAVAVCRKPSMALSGSAPATVKATAQCIIIPRAISGVNLKSKRPFPLQMVNTIECATIKWIESEREQQVTPK